MTATYISNPLPKYDVALSFSEVVAKSIVSTIDVDCVKLSNNIDTSRVQYVDLALRNLANTLDKHNAEYEQTDECIYSTTAHLYCNYGDDSSEDDDDDESVDED